MSAPASNDAVPELMGKEVMHELTRRENELKKIQAALAAELRLAAQQGIVIDEEEPKQEEDDRERKHRGGGVELSEIKPL